MSDAPHTSYMQALEAQSEPAPAPSHCLPDSAVNDILGFCRGYPTIIPGAIVAPNAAGKLQIISIDEACDIIRQKALPATFDCPNSLKMVLQMGCRYNF